ncbi:MAG: molybdopterin molybdotransferase MoeA [Pirellulales bacterium]|nr:molybdopterin molybdotransferase MoeA [Pirellulales bacterium]
MISVEDAQRLVLEQATALPAERVELVDSLGLVLAEAVASDIDSPPWEKSIVDGYAVRSVDLATGEAELEILEEVMAGAVPTLEVGPGQATRIMTGAPTPAGCDAVVMVEQTEVLPAVSPGTLGRVRIHAAKLEAGRNILRRAAAMKCGDPVLAPGAIIRPAEIGLLAEVGKRHVLAQLRARVAVLATGDEIVSCEQKPGPGQIRNSNGPMLCGLVRRAGGTAHDLGIAADTTESLDAHVRRGLEADVLVLSGGVSAGVLDLVPGVLAANGVEQVFHKVNVKPGKPIWFGVLNREDRRRLVFGLPGNPVSSLVCFELFVRSALRQLAGERDVLPRPRWARLTRSHTIRGPRDTYHPAVLEESEAGWTVEPVAWRGSADLRALSAANSLVLFPGGDRTFEPGARLATILL